MRKGVTYLVSRRNRERERESIGRRQKHIYRETGRPTKSERDSEKCDRETDTKRSKEVTYFVPRRN